MKILGWIAGLIALSAVAPASAVDIAGAGSSFVAPVLAKWSTAYAARTGMNVKYQSIGSGGGIVEIKAQAVDFGVSDAALQPRDLQKLGLAQFPIVMGGIVPVVNVEGIKAGDLRFTGALLADIFLGKAKSWDDPANGRLNPDVRLPAAPIKVVHRLDGAGTPFNWAHYLSKVSPDRSRREGQRRRHCTRPADQQLHRLCRVRIRCSEQARLWSDSESGGQVREASSVELSGGGCRGGLVESSRFRAALDFLRWALAEGQKLAAELDYVSLPAGLVTQVEAYWTTSFAPLD